MIVLKRVYDDDAKHAKFKVLVDRIWPRGLLKTGPAPNEWCKEIAPSNALRKWFNRWYNLQLDVSCLRL